MNTYIEHYNSKEELYCLIRDYIITMDFKPGDMFSETSISERLNAGRVMVREVIAKLHDEGYVDVFPQKGTYVAKIDSERVKQSVYAHTVLEQAIIEEIMNRGITKEEIKILRDVLAQQKAEKEKGNILNIILKVYELNSLLFEFCGRNSICDFFRGLDSHLLRIEYLQHSTFDYHVNMSSLTSIENVLLESRLLIDNLERGDGNAAILSCSNRYAKILWQAEMIKGIYPQYFSD